ncbi:MAG: preprotein translocase subunit SecA [Gammaproteobacteria bacterium]|nr:MAG: preprotein translocase subunit SecA [Gammaproteobacteria bacterium]RLA50245.1 MAG: preprotein translocase subunit SecA [Gammaproteobacteria bacterium]
MVAKVFKKVFGTKNDRELRRLRKIISAVSTAAADVEALSDGELREQTAKFRKRLEENENLDQLIPEAFAVVREASSRTLGLRHFDVQLIGGLVLHEGKIAEMRTGEGKTLAATLAAYLNALTGAGVHIVTVNDYLARRDAEWMAPIYNALGMDVGIIQSYAGAGVANSFLIKAVEEGTAELEPVSRQLAYAADITYGTNNEFGFDYLRDNMVLRLQDKAQRGLGFAIVDEVDSILIDESRTPLIISGTAQDSSHLYKRTNAIVQLLDIGYEPDQTEAPDEEQNIEQEIDRGDFVIDEKSRQVELTEQGHEKVEKVLVKEGLLGEGESLYQPAHLNLLHHVHNALRAHNLFHNDVEYIVQNGEVVLIDEHTGRTMAGRRLSEGLHQAIEAKEGVQIQSESQTLASTTFQNYFRLYDKLSGMTGTADTEAFEFQHIYGLQVVVIPTNQQVARDDLNDLIYLTQQEKFAAVIEDVQSCIDKGAPVLVGTASIESSEVLSLLLKKASISHQVLNAKFHEKEAQIIAEAGRPSAVTIATNMAGRGTDIVLGGKWELEIDELKQPTQEKVEHIKADWAKRHEQVIAAGGLHILGTERHESRRIDNQLRGRAGRQGDPGVSRFYLSMEDTLMRLFASDRVKNMMRAIGMEDGEAIEHRMVTNAIEKAQRKVEGRNFDVRKQLLEYDDVANDQRKVIYEQRNELLGSDDISAMVEGIRHDVVSKVIDHSVPPQSLHEQWLIDELEENLRTEFNLNLPLQQWLDDDERLNEEKLRERVLKSADELYEQRCTEIGPDMKTLEKQVMLQVQDDFWKEHLASIDHLRQGIGLRAYAQKNPKQEYKRESFELFQDMLENIKQEAVRFLSRVEIRKQDEVEELERQRLAEQRQRQMEFEHAAATAMATTEMAAKEDGSPAQNSSQPFVRTVDKVGRNALCPCESGKKYKHCHGKFV